MNTEAFSAFCLHWKISRLCAKRLLADQFRPRSRRFESLTFESLLPRSSASSHYEDGTRGTPPIGPNPRRTPALAGSFPSLWCSEWICAVADSGSFADAAASSLLPYFLLYPLDGGHRIYNRDLFPSAAALIFVEQYENCRHIALSHGCLTCPPDLVYADLSRVMRRQNGIVVEQVNGSVTWRSLWTTSTAHSI